MRDEWWSKKKSVFHTHSNEHNYTFVSAYSKPKVQLKYILTYCCLGFSLWINLHMQSNKKQLDMVTCRLEWLECEICSHITSPSLTFQTGERMVIHL